jgi:hypothetical protein
MSGHQSFQGLIKDFSPEKVERIDQKKQALAQLELKKLHQIFLLQKFSRYC